MISAVSMKEVKRRVSASNFADGLWDILLGLFVGMFSFNLLLIALICYTACYFVVLRLRPWLTYTRIGYTQIHNNRKYPVILFMAFFICMIGFISSIFTQGVLEVVWLFPRAWHWLKPLLAIYVAFIAFRFKVKRWYVYAALILTGFSLLVWPPIISQWSSLAIEGMIILTSGIVILVRFIRNNPKMELEELPSTSEVKI